MVEPDPVVEVLPEDFVKAGEIPYFEDGGRTEAGLQPGSEDRQEVRLGEKIDEYPVEVGARQRLSPLGQRVGGFPCLQQYGKDPALGIGDAGEVRGGDGPQVSTDPPEFLLLNLAPAGPQGKDVSDRVRVVKSNNVGVAWRELWGQRMAPLGLGAQGLLSRLSSQEDAGGLLGGEHLQEFDEDEATEGSQLIGECAWAR